MNNCFRTYIIAELLTRSRNFTTLLIYSLTTVFFALSYLIFLIHHDYNNAEPTGIRAQKRWRFLHAALLLCTLSAFFQLIHICKFLQLTRKLAPGSCCCFLLFHPAPPAHNSARIRKVQQVRGVWSEVKLHLAASSALVISACPLARHHTRLFTDGSWIFDWFIYLFYLCHRPKTFSLLLWTFGWEDTCTHTYFTTLCLWRIVPDRQSCSLIITNLRRARVPVLPGGLCNIPVLLMQTHIHTESFNYRERNRMILAGWSTNL